MRRPRGDRFVNGFVGVLEFDVFSDNRDGDPVFRVNDFLDEAFPVLEGG